ncbi:sigma-70 family RNA polymerase sigma factor [Leptobacterium flavescens]|uniref:Sigma-70 family RNA polymerase sigma factor n=1 Tax=Leptobacterium flavescens TaxID=472055 RepID=A0A6P0UQK1_9FLAO|nr:sigma-70 family RNA polymerase sigma factor [Leptobacterium flavescens]NER15237.1 sigma-70 family RNA polymerase sigma factor [Leptobacterium flavescens]
MQDNKEHVCEEKVFQSVFMEHATTIRNFIYYKCGDQNKAADIVQEAFIKLWQKCRDVSFEKSKSFLYTVANNLFLNEVAHQKVVLNYKNSPQRTHTDENPEYLMEEKQYDEKLQRAINSLTEGQREAFLLNRIDGKKYSEIAQLLDISVKAVEKRIHGALVSLRKEIGKI